MQPFESSAEGDLAFNLLLAEPALRAGRTEGARARFERSPALQADSVEAHLGLGRAYLVSRDYGREFNIERADGDASFFGLSPSIGFSITESPGDFAFFWWQNDRYDIERLGTPGDSLVGIGTCNDNRYEVGGGLTWQFLPNWSPNPEILHIRDRSNLLAANYSPTEIWMTLRWDF